MGLHRGVRASQIFFRSLISTLGDWAIVYYNPTCLSLNDMPSKRICRSSDDIIGALISGEKGGTADFYKSLTRNALVREGHSAGVLNDEEFQSSLLYDNTVVKSYLWTFLDDPVHRSRVREYVLQCSTLQQRAYFTLKTAYFACVTGELGLEYNEASLWDSCALK